jgi:predicted nucleic acid-binding protein
MPLTHLLDTSVYCQPLKPRPLPQVESRWRSLGDDALATSVICEAEVLYGIELKQSTRLLVLHDQLLRNKLTILPVDAAIAKTFALVKATARKRGFSASDFDFLIAATAKAHGLTVATLNVRHFNGIQGLAVEDWS